MKTYQVTLTDEHVARVEQLIASGYADSMDDVISEAIAMLANEDHLIAAMDIDSLREKLDIGLEQIQRGEVIDGDTAFALIEAELAEAER